VRHLETAVYTMAKLAVILCFLSANTAWALLAVPDWDYETAASWPINYPDCGRKYQEPQDIPYETTDACLQTLTWHNLDWPQNNVQLVNTYRSLNIYLDLSYPILVSGGPLAAQVWYYGTRLEIKIGNNDTSGSERTIRGRSFPLEFKLELSVERDSVLNEFTNSDSRAVISWFAEVAPTDNIAWDGLLAAIPSVAQGGSEAIGSIGSLASLLPHYEDWEHAYFTYPGSWTTPPCYPDVTRIVYPVPIPLSSAQLAVLRQLADENGVSQGINGARRPIPPPDNRVFLRSFH